MKALLPIDHTEALEALRDEMIKEITTYVPINAKVSCGKNEELFFEYKDSGRVEYYGPRYSGYNDRYNCKLSDLSADDISQILTNIEKED